MTNLRNSVRLIGHLGQSPEIRTTPGGKKVANFSLATNENYVDQNGQKQTETMWHQIVAWGKLADMAERFLDKGKEIAVEGKLSVRNYTDKSGQKRYVTEVILNEIQLLGGKDGSRKEVSEK